MKMVNLRNIKNYCERFWFTPNVVNLRIALMDYFRQEGIKCKLEDGHVNFNYGDYEFNAEFKVFEDYAECIIELDYEDDDYENLEVKDKALLADQVNIREDNHCVVKAYNDVVEVKTFFYFTNTKMISFRSMRTTEVRRSTSCCSLKTGRAFFRRCSTGSQNAARIS